MEKGQLSPEPVVFAFDRGIDEIRKNNYQKWDVSVQTATL
jgi:hypothetical protein